MYASLSVLLLLLLAVLAGGLGMVVRRQAQRIATTTAERKRAEQLLEDSDLRFRILTRATNEAVRDWDIDADSVWWNRNVQTLFGYEE